MKYIIYKDGSFTIFSEGEMHCDMAQTNKEIRSAGKCHLNVNNDLEIEISCFKGSITLGIEEGDGEEDSFFLSHRIH